MGFGGAKIEKQNMIEKIMTHLYATLIIIILGLVALPSSTFSQSANPNDPNDFQYIFVEGGVAHTVALRCNGTVATWGLNSSGQLGINSTTSSDVPITVVSPGGSDSLINIIAVAAGDNHTLALRSDGTVWAWGDNGSGQVGDGTGTSQRNLPVKVVNIGGSDSLTDIVAIAAGGDHSLAIKSNGTAVAWGDNSSGQLGDGSKTDRNAPVFITGIDAGQVAIAVSGGSCVTMLLQGNGRVKTCGCDDAGQLGDDGSSSLAGATSLVYVSKQQSTVDPLDSIIGISAGRLHCLAVDSGGTVWSWGSQSLGSDGFELGRSCGTPQCKFAGTVSTITTAIALATGDNSSFALLSDSSIMAWGDNDQGELGLGDFSDRSAPIANSLIASRVTAVSAGGPHTIVLLETDSIQTWGDNGQGQLGTGTSPTDNNNPATVTGYSMGAIFADAGPDTAYCSGDSVQIGGESPGDYAEFIYSWTPTTGLTANGSTQPDTLSDPYSKLTVSSTITIEYILTKSYRINTIPACINTDTAIVTVNAGTVADFETSVPPGCINKPVNFYNTGTSGGGRSFLWDFGADATPATDTTEFPPAVVYSSAGAKVISLAVVDPLCGSGDVITKIITINDNPTISFTSTAPACMGESVGFTNTGTTGIGVSYLWDFGAGASPATSTVENPGGVMYNSAGTKTVTLTINDGSCTATGTMTITINATPTADFNSNAPVCTNDMITFVNTGTTGATLYSWNFGSGATPGTASVENPAGVIYSTSGVKAVQLVTTLGTCVDMVTKPISIELTPTASFTSTAPQCAATGVDFTNTGSTGGNWLYSWDFGVDALPSTSTIENPNGVIYGSGGSKNVTLTISNGSCLATTTSSITVNISPIADFTSSSPMCAEDSVDFINMGTTGATYMWNFGTGAIPASSTDENPTGIVYSTDGLKTVQLIATLGSCVDSTTQSITINEKPTASFSSTAPACGNVGVDFNNTGSSALKWSYSWDFGIGASPSSSSAENPLDIMYNSSGLKTITLTLSDGICVSSFTQSIIINATPTAAFASTAQSCELDSVDFFNMGSNGGGWTYSWTFGSDAAPANSTDENPADVIYSSNGTKSIELVVSDGTCSDSITQTINIFDRPTVGFNSTAPVCAGLDVIFVNSGSSGNNWAYSWDFGLGAFPSGSSAENPGSIIYSVGGNKTITLTISDGNCTESFSGSITIDELPIVDAGPDTIICANRSVQIGSDSVLGSTYFWFPTTTLDNPFISNPTVSPEATITIYQVTVTGSNSCTNTDTVLVTMLLPLSADAGIDVEICGGDDIQIGAALVEGQFYSWSPSNGLSSTTSPNPMANPSVTTTYTLTVTDDYGCDAITDQVEVIVHPLPMAEAGNDTAIAKGKSMQLIATGGIDYIWSPNYELSNAGIDNPVASPDLTTTYYVQVTDLYGCVSMDSITITVVEPEIWLPVAFTPNGDGHNDILYVRGVVPEDIANFEFSIYDRLGQRIFYTKDGSVGWDGTNMASERELRGGAFVYVVIGSKTDGTVIDMTGMVNLLK
ncbi:MAG: hypothetical protein COB85_03275 [Bacteroidetes bacterium]|nr:MAG: hypothetical protein COB85_03275 [Bacteroidota bacterium]